MKQVLLQNGQAFVEEVAPPQVEEGTVLVRVSHSSISAGTELSGLKTTALPLWRRALEQPDNVKKVWKMIRANGIRQTLSFVEGKVAVSQPTGYSASGVVLAQGEGVLDFREGDRVSCAGAQCAFHAEVIRVPRNLVVPIPDNLDFASASTVTLGAIAMQGVRRALPTLGETFVVIGLGVVGQLIAQLLKVNGLRVIGTDTDPERIRLAKNLGLDIGINPNEEIDIDQVARFTDGIGADGVIIAAASPSHAIVSTAFKMCRKKGRVVLVGNVGLNLQHSDFYEKEIDFFISTSYGPGRYDNTYEEKGLDYPVGYVRWTENRNMAEFLRLLSERKVQVAPLIARTYPIEEAPLAYQALSRGVNPPMMLISYPLEQKDLNLHAAVANPQVKPLKSQNRVCLAVIGAGEFVKNTHLPNLKSLSDLYHLKFIVSRSGHNAQAQAKRFNAEYSLTDYRQVLEDPQVDAVLIGTRNDSHARLALESLEAGKHVFVEKPLALNKEDLDALSAYFSKETAQKERPLLMTGFNRRFSPYAQRILELVSKKTNPMMIQYRMNALALAVGHWVNGKEGGGRNLSEACHIYDLFTYFTESRFTHLSVDAIDPKTSYYSQRDNFVVTITFADGSVATLTYTALGSPQYPKEQMELYCDGTVYALDNYTRLKIVGIPQKGIENRLQDKGHKEELLRFADAIQKSGDWPIPFWQQDQATRIALEVEQCLTHSLPR